MINTQKNNSSSGATLVEIIFVIFMIILFSSILISDFPSLQKSFYLTRAANKLAQDIRRAQDLSLSGFFIKDSAGNNIKISGYGVYINTLVNNHSYTIYADSCPSGNLDYQYTIPGPGCLAGDRVIDTIDLKTYGADLFIKDLTNVTGSQVLSMNFMPPNPATLITSLNPGAKEVIIVVSLQSNPSKTKEVILNQNGLIYVQ
jgi:hypothetical protein